ncbi:ABC-type proline/glycine betaine transport systems, ATPase components [Bacillus thuringiensis serovar tolworthi]|uniref:ABC-type proline/glycine betaine transport systems, ATPase components n=1 Tax=Bacillus thuringiensis subsp. tolworthi TaxID=1442 RepID=A0A9W3ZTK9_BACTO|nr:MULTISPECIES: hypothetical protein [Bacillus cereus group]MEB8715945.1 hypothetical protein [Bacillus cereus]MRB04257.1 hypothetical protein [Bacillus thuringiensis]MEB9430824.1 hypothetical protein [Bacillus cereus]MEB9478155.1 hypothetical protein [Bacillus cereus]MEB9593541.1 hypothetical protein [Bacillus cereus]
MEMLHNEKYGVALQLAKKFVGKSAMRMTLMFVQHSADGTMVATDSHRLCRIKNIHGFDKDYLVNPLTFEVATGDYPKVDKVMPSFEKATISLNEEQIKLWLQIHKSLNQIAKATKAGKTVTLRMSENGFEIELDGTEVKMTAPCELYEFQNVPYVVYSIEYVRDALEMHEKLGTKALFIQIASATQPILLTDNMRLETMVLPVRRH